MKNTLKLERRYGEEWASSSKPNALTTIAIILNGHELTKFTVCTSHDGEREENCAEELWNSLVKALKMGDEPYPVPPPKVKEYRVGKNVVKVIHQRKQRSQVFLNKQLVREFYGEYTVAQSEELFERLVHGLNL